MYLTVVWNEGLTFSIIDRYVLDIAERQRLELYIHEIEVHPST